MLCRIGCLGGGVLPALAFTGAFELAQPVIPVKLLVSKD
jgi:hypothetical protein